MRRGKRRFRFKLAAVFAAVILIGVWIFFSVNVNPIIKKVSEEQVKALATIAVNAAAEQVISECAAYGELIDVKTDDTGKVSLIRVNSPLMNSIAQKMIGFAQKNISELGEQGIHIPLGTLSGMTFLSGRGPEIRIRVFPVGSVDLKFVSDFTEAGINQTRHRIHMQLNSDISVVVPGMNRTVNTFTEVLLCENIIIGEVPDTYLHSDSLDEMLNLLP